MVVWHCEMVGVLRFRFMGTLVFQRRSGLARRAFFHSHRGWDNCRRSTQCKRRERQLAQSYHRQRASRLQARWVITVVAA